MAWRINQGMPVTATAMITTILLAMHGTGLTFDEIRLALADGLSYLSSRGIPQTASAGALSAAEPVRATLDALVAGGLVTFVGDGREPVWLIDPEHQLAATFYRNSAVHFLLDTALCELAVLRARDDSTDPVGAFWAEIAWLRDLLKFEFYFREREEHRRQVRAEMERHDPAWESRLRSGPGAADALLAEMRPLVSQVIVRPFVEAYRLVADVLATEDVSPGVDTLADDAEVTRRALGLGHQYVAQRRLRSSESVSVLLFQTALQLARNRGLFDPGEDLAKRRAAFLTELRNLLRRIDYIEDLATRATSGTPAPTRRGRSAGAVRPGWRRRRRLGLPRRRGPRRLGLPGCAGRGRGLGWTAGRGCGRSGGQGRAG